MSAVTFRCLQLAVLALMVGNTAARAAEFRPTAQAQIVPAGAKLELLWDQGEFTEGPAASKHGAIFFSDIGDRILRFDPQLSDVAVFREPSGKANGLVFDRQERLIACEGANGGARRVSITADDGTVTVLADRYQGKRFNSPNDVTVDPAGRVYFSDPRYVGSEPVELDFAGVFVVVPGQEVRLATRDVNMPNGLAPSPDGRTLYVADNSPAADGNHQLLAFAIGADGTLSDKRVLF
ncbi:MAG: SMP-30/gluconolactonase/LRE family protein, partial [Planctomycetaceae bacterium]|nr:SMP-30/gluconolactonase/LRE family protein [Planctomycetaceae bacterium]